jgi:hypothetical protein
MIGKFHLGLQYDMNIWHQNANCGVYPCQEEKETQGANQVKRKGFTDRFVVVTESILLYLEPDHKIKNVTRLIAWFTLPSLEQIKRTMDRPDSISFIWRKLEDAQQLEFKMLMQNSSGCLDLIVKHMKALNITVNKGYERKRKILESEVTSESATKGINIDDLHAIIQLEEGKLTTEPTRAGVDSLMELYNKAIVYYSALSDEKHLEYLQKLQRLFSDERVQKIM